VISSLRRCWHVMPRGSRACLLLGSGLSKSPGTQRGTRTARPAWLFRLKPDSPGRSARPLAHRLLNRSHERNHVSKCMSERAATTSKPRSSRRTTRREPQLWLAGRRPSWDFFPSCGGGRAWFICLGGEFELLPPRELQRADLEIGAPIAFQNPSARKTRGAVGAAGAVWSPST